MSLAGSVTRCSAPGLVPVQGLRVPACKKTMPIQRTSRSSSSDLH